MTGIELIAQERKEQIEKHKHFDDKVYYLDILAIYCLLHDNDAERDNYGYFLWQDEKGFKLDKKSKEKIDNKTRLERLIVSGALIAAELDRIIKERDGENKKDIT